MKWSKSHESLRNLECFVTVYVQDIMLEVSTTFGEAQVAWEHSLSDAIDWAGQLHDATMVPWHARQDCGARGDIAKSQAMLQAKPVGLNHRFVAVRIPAEPTEVSDPKELQLDTLQQLDGMVDHFGPQISMPGYDKFGRK